MVLTNGGISVGDFDYIKDVLEDLGAEPVFWRVAQKPGGPLGLWMLEGKLVFGIPGNPVAAMIMFEEYVRPALRRMLGYAHLHRPERMGHLAAPWRKHGPGRPPEFPAGGHPAGGRPPGGGPHRPPGLGPAHPP